MQIAFELGDLDAELSKGTFNLRIEPNAAREDIREDMTEHQGAPVELSASDKGHHST